MIGLGIGINAYGTTSAQAQAVREAYLAFRSRVLADGGEIPSPPLAQSFLRAVYAQELNSSLVFAGLPAYKTTTDLVDKWYDINENDGVGTTTTRPELVGFAPEFDNADDKIQITHNANQLLTSGGCLMMWVKVDSQDASIAKGLFDKSSATTGLNGWRWTIRTTAAPGGFSFTINNGTQINSADNAYTIGEWAHLAIVFTAAGVVTMYVNGVPNGAGGTTGAASGITTTNPILLGERFGFTASVDASIALPAIFNSQPTQAQIRAIVNQTSRYFT